ncbi:Helix-turn-helix domain protein [Paenibacillus sp. P1XP2]|nr:Helix-turn-helix domain protein [Paenibacillus sp. P1XP2]
MEFNVNRDSLSLFAALASDTRIKMVEMLSREPLNIKEMAQKLGISSAIVTKHVQQLKEAASSTPKFRPESAACRKNAFWSWTGSRSFSSRPAARTKSSIRTKTAIRYRFRSAITCPIRSNLPAGWHRKPS